MDQLNRDLDDLFAKYKESLPDPDPSAGFMPELWRRIEARQSMLLRVRKLTQVFVGAAAAASLLFAMVQVIPQSSRTEISGSYVDALAAAHPAENLASLGIVPHDPVDQKTK